MSGDYTDCGGIDYKSGKAFHIYRPKIFDSNDNWVWADLHIEGEIATITIPQDFLDNAQYPVIVDPTIGYTVIGASFDTGLQDMFVASACTLMPNYQGIMTKIQAAVYNSTTGNIKLAAYANTATMYPNVNAFPNTLLTNSSSGSLAVNQTTKPSQDSDWTSSTGVNALMSSNTYYWMAINSDDPNLRIACDSGPAYCEFYKGQSFAVFPSDPAPSSASSDGLIYSIYATFLQAVLNVWIKI